MYDKSQLMRGTLEGCILKILSKNTSYGYEIVTTLLGYGFKKEDCRRTVRPTGILWENRSNDQQSDHKEKVKAG